VIVMSFNRTRIQALLKSFKSENHIQADFVKALTGKLIKDSDFNVAVFIFNVTDKPALSIKGGFRKLMTNLFAEVGYDIMTYIADLKRNRLSPTMVDISSAMIKLQLKRDKYQKIYREAPDAIAQYSFEVFKNIDDEVKKLNEQKESVIFNIKTLQELIDIISKENARLDEIELKLAESLSPRLQPFEKILKKLNAVVTQCDEKINKLLFDKKQSEKLPSYEVVMTPEQYDAEIAVLRERLAEAKKNREQRKPIVDRVLSQIADARAQWEKEMKLCVASNRPQRLQNEKDQLLAI